MKKTRKKIENAFLFLISQKSILQITTSDIISQAGVAKGTFYHNFSSKAEILKSLEVKITQQIVHEYIQRYRAQHTESMTAESFVRLLSDSVLPVIYANRDELRVINSSDINELWQHLLVDRYARLIKKLFPNCDDFHIKLFIKYVNMVISFWIINLIPTDQQIFKTQFSQFITHKVIETLKK